jgi:alkylhydroperoxidase family enzyme
MARISLNPPRTLSYRMAGWFTRRKFGVVLDPIRAMAHHNQVLKVVGRLNQGARRWRRVDDQIKYLAEMAAVAKVGCEWCMDLGYWVMHGHGISPAKIEAVPHWRDSELFDPLERLVLEYAEAMTETPPTVDDALVKKLRDHLDEAQLVELTMMIGVENLSSRFNSAIGLTGQGFKDRCEVPTVDVAGNHRTRAGRDPRVLPEERRER